MIDCPSIMHRAQATKRRTGPCAGAGDSERVCATQNLWKIDSGSRMCPGCLEVAISSWMLEGAAFAIHNSRSEPCDNHTGHFIGAHIRLPSPHARSAAKSRDDEFPGLLIIPAYQTLYRPGQRHALSEAAYEMSMCIVMFDITEDFDPIQSQELSKVKPSAFGKCRFGSDRSTRCGNRVGQST